MDSRYELALPLYLTEAHLRLRDMARHFANEAIRPMAEAPGRDERFPTEIYQQMAKIPRIYESTHQIQRMIIARELIKHGTGA